MTEAFSKLPAKPTSLVALITSLIGIIYGAGMLAGKVEGLERDRDRQQQEIATLQRQVGGLYAHIRRLQNWPSRAAEPSMKTDQQ